MRPNSVDDERLRRAYQSHSNGRGATADCPGDDAIWEAAAGELDPGRVQQILDHAATCAACQESWRMARELLSATARPEQVRKPRRRWLFGAGIAAAAAIAFALFVPVNRDSSPGASGQQFREVDNPTLESLLEEDASLPRSACVLRWVGGPEGTIYTIEVALNDLTVIDRTEELEATEHRVAESALAEVPTGTAILWRVEALLPDASRIASPVYRAIVE